MAAGDRQTPMEEQYDEIRNTLAEKTLLFFRLGDFYELFREDAEIASGLLGLTLTKRNGMAMAGVPRHAANGYVRKLLDCGWKVAICDQLEPPQHGRIVRRALTRTYTPGTLIEDDQLDARSNHYMLAFDVGASGAVHGAWLDTSTGELRIATSPDGNAMLASLSALEPKEILVREGLLDKSFGGGPWLDAFRQLPTRRLTVELPQSHFDGVGARAQICELLAVRSLAPFSIEDGHPSLGPAGALMRYAAKNLGGELRNLYAIREIRFDEAMLLDKITANNLEIFRSVRGTADGSLIQAVDRTVTAAGARLLREFFRQPLLSVGEIEKRQNCVGEFFENWSLTESFREMLRSVRDILRILSRLRNRLRQPRELGGVVTTLETLPNIANLFAKSGHMELASAMAKTIGDFSQLRKYLRSALADNLPQDTSSGGFIRDGFDEKLDSYRNLLRYGESQIKEIEERERASTAIKNLKIKCSGTFGYFIEVTKANVGSVPPHYIRRQTTVNGERYVTAELRAKESEIIEAQNNALHLELEIFEEAVDRLFEEEQQLAAAARTLAELDVFSSWAALARGENYVKPTVNAGQSLSISGGRHPVIEQSLRRCDTEFCENANFTPNGTELHCDGCQIALLTGPNMGGKSTYMRQVAIIVFLAQIGCWVPADSATVGLVDRILSRIVCGDDLSRGRSTFMVEMEETAAIIRSATDKSLLIMDEIGRGTSTYDGLSIAWALLEHIHGSGNGGPRTLFATHYRELTALSQSLPRLHNFHMSVREVNGSIIFLRKVSDGPADRSYGIQVARLAGLPDAIVSRAKKILSHLEKTANASDFFGTPNLSNQTGA
ncbi:MAG: DNA mismatch repair protein MutS [Puniceicoccales bacterium]|jgi:DNA mismatch repair protein MutS|nr:DNA mismatch repair protein MutS [Puniceicoccales bacterium]